MSGISETLRGGPELVFSEPGYDELWQKLEGSDPERVALLTGTRSLGGGRCVVKMIGADYQLEAGERRVTGPVNRPAPDKRAALCLLNYLAGAGESRPSGRLAPETVLPGGERFFSGGHALTRQPILTAFGRDGAALLGRAQTLGAETVDNHGEGFSFRLDLLPKIPVQVTLSEEDDEFPAALYYAFDSAAADHVPLPIISALVGLLNTCLTA